MAKRGRPRRVLFSVGLGQGSAVKTGETDEVQETDRVPISGSDGVFLNSDELHASIDEGVMGDMVNCGGVSTDPVLMDDVAMPRDEPYLQALQKGTTVDVDGQAPNPLAGNRDTRRGLQLSNEEKRNEELVFTLEDVAGERSYWDNALIGWGHKPASCSSGGNPVHRPSVVWMKKSQGSSGPSHLGASVSSCQPSCSLQMPVDGQGYNLRPNRQNNWQIVERKKKGKQKEGVGDSTSDCALIKPQCPPMHDDVDGQGRFRPAATPPVDNGDDDPRCLERQRPQ
ncbi:hypothetical protein Dimus_006054 [Dionaea muscipula]